MEYKGYLIHDCGDGTYDILESLECGELVDGEFKTIEEAIKYIDGDL